MRSVVQQRRAKRARKELMARIGDRDKDEEPKEIFEEYEYDGFKLKWNKETNVLLDPDDDEVMGKMTEKDGEWVPEIISE